MSKAIGYLIAAVAFVFVIVASILAYCGALTCRLVVGRE